MATVAQQKLCDDDLESLPRASAPTRRLQDCVLLIEDSEDSMLLVKYALQEFGDGKYRLEWASNLSNGLDQLADGGVDVVLLDLGLPESNGPASYAWVREMAPQLPVVVLTGDSCEETEVTVTASGVDDYLVKDKTSGALLLEAIHAAIISHKRAQRQLTRKTAEHPETQKFHWTSES